MSDLDKCVCGVCPSGDLLTLMLTLTLSLSLSLLQGHFAAALLQANS